MSENTADTLLYGIGAVAKLTGLTDHTIPHYPRLGAPLCRGSNHQGAQRPPTVHGIRCGEARTAEIPDGPGHFHKPHCG
jgi:hypothetical protein